MSIEAPARGELDGALGRAAPLWRRLVEQMQLDFPGLREEWRPSKGPFGRICLLKRKERTLLYLIPLGRSFDVSLVLGDRAAALALGGDLPASAKKMISGAKRYPEGLALRFPVSTAGDAALAARLAAFKTAPR